MECEVHPESEKLYIEKIDVGEGKLRTIGSGL
jgi:tRNA-binding EMAP/Myf-like protein